MAGTGASCYRAICTSSSARRRPDDRDFAEPDDFVILRCNIHPTAKAHLQVVPTPVFTLCDGEGKFVLPGCFPKGKHVLRAFFPGAGWAEKASAIRGDEGEVAVDLELVPRPKTRAPHDRAAPP